MKCMTYWIDGRNKRNGNKSNRNLINNRHSEQVLHLSRSQNKTLPSTYLFLVMKTLTTLSIQVPRVLLSNNSIATNPPPQPVAMDESVAETTLPPYRIAASTPQEDMQ